MKKLLVFIICILMTFTSVNALELSSKHVVLYNLNENKVVYEVNMDERTNIASLTKIMTTLVALENIEDYNTKITMTSKMFSGLSALNAYVIGLRVGQVVTYNDLLYGTFVASGADAARGLTISIAGSEENFVKMMNEKAKELGLKDTVFSDTTGLDEDYQYSTVSDVAIVLNEALKNDKFKEIFTAESYLLSDKSMTIYSSLRATARNYNYDVSYIEGAKTGYNINSGKCLASVAYDEVNGIKYMLVTTQASTSTSDAYHIKDAVTVYNYYFENYKYHNIVDINDLLVTLPTKYGKVSEVSFYAKEEIKYYLNNTYTKEDISYKYTNMVEEITTNMNVGDKLGTVEVIYNDEVLASIDILLENKIEFSLWVFIVVHKLYFILGSILFVLLIVLFFKIKNFKKKKRKR